MPAIPIRLTLYESMTFFQNVFSLVRYKSMMKTVMESVTCYNEVSDREYNVIVKSAINLPIVSVLYLVDY